jgi:hypothetical protein
VATRPIRNLDRRLTLWNIPEDRQGQRHTLPNAVTVMQHLHQQLPSRFYIKPDTPLLRSTFGQRRHRASYAAYGMQQWGPASPTDA